MPRDNHFIGAVSFVSLVRFRQAQCRENGDCGCFVEMEPGTLARVLHDFFTTVDGELSLSKGHYFLIYEIVDKHWCSGQSQDRVGKFPLSHLHKVEIPEFSQAERLFVAIAGFPGQETGDLSFAQGDLIIGTRDIGSGWCMGRTSSNTGIFPTTHTWELDTILIKKTSRKKSIRRKAKVNTTLKAQLEEELDLIAGEVVTVTEILDDGWCRGITENGKEGTFPEGFISYTDVDEDSTGQVEMSTTRNNLTWPTSYSSAVYSNLGEATSVTPPIPEEPAPNYFDLFPEALASTSSTADTQCDTHPKSVDVKPYAITLYPFNAQFPNELSFGAGEVVHLTRHIDSEWMEGMIDTTKGIFPSSYVNIIVDCVEAENIQAQPEVDAIPAKKHALEPGVTVKVLYTFDAQMDGDLSVHEGDVVTVVDTANEDWVNVKNKSGLVGLCPREYLSSALDHSSSQLPESTEGLEDFVVIRHKEENVTTSEEQKPKRMSQPHRPAPPAPAPGRVPLQKDAAANAEPSVQGGSERNESVTDGAIDIREKRADQRQNVISELVITEKEYVRDLKLTYETFNLYDPNSLTSKGIDVSTLFGNILEVIHIAEELLDMILRAMKGRDESLQMIGPCFVKMAEKLKTVYVKYCGNHEASLTLLKKYENNEEIMRIFNKGIEALRHQIACFDMSSILIKPVQRILKYPLILYELIKCTEDNHLDKATTEDAWKAMTNVASYINEYKRRKDIVSKYLDNDNTLIGKMSKLSMHSVAKMSTRLSTRLSASLGLTNVACDVQFEELEKQFRSIEKCTWQLAKDVEQCTVHLNEEAMSGDVIAEFLGHYYQGTTSDVKRFQEIRSTIWSQYMPDFKSCIEKRVNAPLHLLATLLEGPAVLISKRHDKLLDYDAAISKSEKYKESKIVQEELFTAKSNYEALNQQLLEELPILLDSAANILVSCISAFAGARKLLSGRITKQYLTLCEASPHLSTQDVLESFLVNHNLVWNQITRFAFAGTNPRVDEEGQAQLCMQSEKQRIRLREKYAADKLYIVVEDVASTSALDVGAARGTLVAAIKKQDPMGDPAKWYVDTGITQGFLPSQKLKPAQQSPPRDSAAATNVAATRKSPPNLMSLDSPEKEVRKASQSHLQDLLSLDMNKEPRVSRTYSNIPETPRVQVYQNINSEFYYAMYDFAANIPGTLSIMNGQALRLLRPHDEKGNDEWWLVENRDGKQGYVPRNYLHSKVKPKS
ncbi:PREDICTED: dynamin-binding protein-like [Dinoponera quadriceps]|uniref:Dynamin-binding protein n=1 Tax=Dinoponera quadriceps TaxID=609295 RepID=A0A6P3XW89_DINQU|nr:PREDICTED: dynamin-binding protein-like [Dinoponera quadriceps]